MFFASEKDGTGLADQKERKMINNYLFTYENESSTANVAEVIAETLGEAWRRFTAGDRGQMKIARLLIVRHALPDEADRYVAARSDENIATKRTRQKKTEGAEA